MTESINTRTNAVPNEFARRELQPLFASTLTDLTALWKKVNIPFTASVTYDPPSLATLVSTKTDVPCPGALVGDFCLASFSLTVSGINVTAYVSQANVVTVVFDNATSGTLDIASGTLKVLVFPKASADVANGMLKGAKVIDVASLTSKAATADASMTVTGAALGDYVMVSADIDLQGLTVCGYVSAADTVHITVQNDTAGTIDLASTTFHVRVLQIASFAKVGVIAGVAGVILGTATFDAASALTQTNQTTTLTATGAVLGDFVIVGHGVDLSDMYITGYVSSADTVTVSFTNMTAGTLDLASATLKCRVIPQGGYPTALTLNTTS